MMMDIEVMRAEVNQTISRLLDLMNEQGIPLSIEGVSAALAVAACGAVIIDIDAAESSKITAMLYAYHANKDPMPPPTWKRVDGGATYLLSEKLRNALRDSDIAPSVISTIALASIASCSARTFGMAAGDFVSLGSAFYTLESDEEHGINTRGGDA